MVPLSRWNDSTAPEIDLESAKKPDRISFVPSIYVPSVPILKRWRCYSAAQLSIKVLKFVPLRTGFPQACRLGATHFNVPTKKKSVSFEWHFNTENVYFCAPKPRSLAPSNAWRHVWTGSQLKWCIKIVCWAPTVCRLLACHFVFTPRIGKMHKGFIGLPTTGDIISRLSRIPRQTLSPSVRRTAPLFRHNTRSFCFILLGFSKKAVQVDSSFER
jgi:hypothetical protein